MPDPDKKLLQVWTSTYHARAIFIRLGHGEVHNGGEWNFLCERVRYFLSVSTASAERHVKIIYYYRQTEQSFGIQWQWLIFILQL